jgi:acetyl-CoA acyltransferase
MSVGHPRPSCSPDESEGEPCPAPLREVVFVDGVRTPFGKAGEKGIYAQTRADDLVIRASVNCCGATPNLPKERVEEVAIAATTQIGDQGLTLGRLAALLSGLPNTTPGYSVDRMCAGAMTAVTNVAGAISFGADRRRHRRWRRAHGPPPDG